MNNPKLNIKKHAINFCFLASIVTSFSALSASITTYRIYIDKDKSTESFMVFSKKPVDEVCHLGLVHNNFDAAGQMTRYPDDSTPDNSAKPWLRFTPKNFKLKSSTAQAVRFSMRRKANVQPAEYRSYLSIECHEITPEKSKAKPTQGTAAVGLEPRLVQNVPVVVRTGRLNAKLTFGTTKIVDDKIFVTLNRTGNRSVYGKLSLIDKSSGDLINFTDAISIYTETTTSTFDFPLSGHSPEQIKLRFEEDNTGSIVIERDLIKNK
ncbi:MAG: hypothetical protein ACI87J_002061 [Colwellia sp.]|jgi:hypothetical protein